MYSHSQLLRLPRLMERLDISRSSVYAHVENGLLPRPIKIGRRAAAWPQCEIDAVVKARIAGRSEDDIRRLVAELINARGAADQVI